MKFQFKHWKTLHSYTGLIFGIIILVISVTGFILVDEDKFGLKDQPITFAPLVAWYDNMPEMKKDYKEREVVTLYTSDGKPVEVASDHGAILVAEAEDRWVKADESVMGFAVTKKAFAKTEAPKAKPLHWAKVMDDLHTGKFFGGWLNLLYYITALSLVFFVLSGVYLWYKPWAQKRARKAAKNVSVRTQRVPARKSAPVATANNVVTANDNAAETTK